MFMQAGEDPLLVGWRHGLGRVMAFTSDLSGRWGRDWVSWQALPQWAGQLARHTMRQIVGTGLRTEFHPEREAVRVVADLKDSDGRFANHLRLRGNVSTPRRSAEEAVFQQTAPGRYEANFYPGERGIYFITLFAAEESEAPRLLATIPYIAPFPEEYRELQPNYALLSRLAEETGGKMLDRDNFASELRRLYTPASGRATRGHETWWALTAAGLLLFLVDLIVRSWLQRAALLGARPA
jgi:hypothetical protein